MKIVIAPDSFKGTIGAFEVAKTVAEAFIGVADLKEIPVSDGGEGTLQCFRAALGGKYIDMSVANPFLERINAKFLLIDDTAVIECAECIGLNLVADRKNVKLSGSYGFGELIKGALDLNVKRILLTLGGSATNDGGAGMLAALGARFTDVEGLPMLPTGGTLEEIGGISLSDLDPRIKNTEFVALTDVTAPLLGENGATMVFAKQKGADDEDLPALEKGMAHYAALLSEAAAKDCCVPGSGAAGGIGAAAFAALNAKIASGAASVLELSGFYREISDADLIITGEGRLDRQSFMGKVVGTVAAAARESNIPVYVLAGDVAEDMTPDFLTEQGIAMAVKCSVSSDPVTISQRARADLYRAALDLKELLFP